MANGDTLIDHASRMWHSECENAARINRRSQLVSGGSIALLGLGLVRFEWRVPSGSEPVMHWFFAATINALLLVALLALAKTLATIYLGPESPGKHQSATELMEFKPSDIGAPIGTMVFVKTYNAYRYLKGRNEVARQRVLGAQKWLYCSVVCIFLAFLVYIPASFYGKISDGDNGHDNAQHTSGITETGQGIAP